MRNTTTTQLSHRIKVLVLIGLSVILAACGSTPQPTISLLSNTATSAEQKVGFAYIPPADEATTHIYGAACLLCYGVASSLTSSLDKHLESTITQDELDAMRDIIKGKYESKFTTIIDVTLPGPVNKLPKFKGELGFAKRDFTSLKNKLDVDVLVVFEVYEHGAFRSFSNYIPNGDPQGYVSGIVYAVDLSNNSYLHYQPIRKTVQPSGEWDEPSDFPTVTTAYYQAIEDAKKLINDTM